MIVETINMVVNDFEHTYKRTDDDDELAPKVTVVLEAIVADIPIANTSINSFKDGSKSTQKEVHQRRVNLFHFHISENIIRQFYN